MSISLRFPLLRGHSRGSYSFPPYDVDGFLGRVAHAIGVSGETGIQVSEGFDSLGEGVVEPLHRDCVWYGRRPSRIQIVIAIIEGIFFWWDRRGDLVEMQL